jgi:hypothetical protein
MSAFTITFEDEKYVYYFPNIFDDEVIELQDYLKKYSKPLTTTIYQNKNLIDNNVPETLHSMLYGNEDGDSLLTMQHQSVTNNNGCKILLHIDYY